MLQALLFKQNIFSADTANNWQIIISCHRSNPEYTKKVPDSSRVTEHVCVSLHVGLDVFYKLFINKIYICINPPMIMDYTKYTTFSIDKNNKYVINIC